MSTTPSGGEATSAGGLAVSKLGKHGTAASSRRREPAPCGNLFFDRFWSSYLRLMVVARLEAQLLSPKPARNRGSTPSLSLIPGKQPTLVLTDGDGQPKAELPVTELPSDLLGQLVLA